MNTGGEGATRVGSELISSSGSGNKWEKEECDEIKEKSEKRLGGAKHLVERGGIKVKVVS